MKLKIALLAAAGSLAMVSAASAQDQGYYGELGFGYTFAEDENDFEDTGSAVPASFVTNYDLDESLNIYGSFGKYLNNGLRAELELSTRTQEIDELKGDGLGFVGFPSGGNIGDLTVHTLMVNVFKDFTNESRFTPYIGAGVGLGYIRPEANNSSIVSAPASSPNQPYLIVMGDKDYATAVQALAGFTFDLTDTVDVDLGYRYLVTDSFEYGAAINGPVTPIEAGYRAQEVTAGLRWNFGAPAPVVIEEEPPVTYKNCWDGSRVVSTATCPPEPEIVEDQVIPDDLDLVVYFDFDKSNLSVAAQDLIAAKSAEALEYNPTSVTVQGNTDTSGSASYNNALSARRAAVVREALVANGISGGLITTQALGESNPAKPTADGVREPLNRRTEVMFDF
ncbi:OmpA family protein [Parvularcula flava]|uniref:Membrane protein n=1 Tax=Aquisalinus luteolus TaxID=1566827 RepID=A0A8J3EPW3_9PROT|nr:OmpA family protein [Aquisalinus luteolus]NHK26494.1 OmpA family protein [Aquisalinus luteolus]GGH92508.1 membrane protein [Aquisalinus luteolus]